MSATPASRSAVLSASTFDDACAQSATFSGWDLHYAQMRGGAFAGTATVVRLQGLHLIRETNNLTLSQYGATPADQIVFGVPLAVAGTPMINGMQQEHAHVTAVRGAREFDFLAPPMDLMVLAIHRRVLDDHVRSLEQVDIDGWIAHGPLTCSDAVFSRRLGTRLCAMLEALFAGALPADNPLVLEAVRSELLSLVTPLVTGHRQLPRPSLSAFGRTQVVKRAREFIMAHIEMPLQIADLCRALSVSRRALQYSFQHVLGTTPSDYLRVLRLNGARRDLLSDGAPARVQDVAARWGFWHLSRFGGEYRRMFGELPSQTLRSARTERPLAA